jgi:hypothetical protein
MQQTAAIIKNAFKDNAPLTYRMVYGTCPKNVISLNKKWGSK